MVGIDDVVAELELDVLDLASDLDLLSQCSFFDWLYRNGVLLWLRPTVGGPGSSL
jgi:hypothetical protein